MTPRRRKDNRDQARIDDDVFVGARIKVARLAARLSQRDLAAAIGTTIGPVQHYERGRNSISPSRLVAVANATGRTVAYFFGEALA